MISLNPHDCPFLSHVMDEEIGPGLTQGHWAGPGRHRGNFWGGWVQSWFLCSVPCLRTLLLSCCSQGGGNHSSSQGDRTSLLDFSPATGSGHLYRKKCSSWFSSHLDIISVHSASPLEKEMATHSSTFAWKVPWMEEPGGLQSMGSLRVGHDWATSLLLFTFMHWRRKWQPTPVFLPGESQGHGSLVGCRLCRTESDTTEVT